MTNQLTQPTAYVLYQLQEVLEKLTNEQYAQKVPLLSNASIGQHTRHIIEFFQELDKGYKTGYVNYDARKRDYEIETHRIRAIEKLMEICRFIQEIDKPLILVAAYGANDASLTQVTTTYLRELMYTLEHTIHHMALLRIGIQSVSTVELPEDFGVAGSTIKHRKARA
ncbi:MAG: hypothetical protein J7621_07090 [Niastella sp.]|nr:hypothetical protein [Niastella sp.]